MAIRPLHALTQGNGKGAAIVGDLPTFGDIGDDFIAGIVPEQDFVMPTTAIAIPEIGRTAEAPAPRATVFADLVHRLDHQRLLADPFLHWRQFPGLDQFCQLGGLLHTFWPCCRVRDDFWTLQFPYEFTATRSLRRARALPSIRTLPAHRVPQRATISLLVQVSAMILAWGPPSGRSNTLTSSLIRSMEHTVRPAPL